MKKFLTPIYISFITLLSCSKPEPDPGPWTAGSRIFLPGECLDGTTLSCKGHLLNDTRLEIYLEASYLGITDLPRNGYSEACPYDYVFTQFGTNAATVKTMFLEYAYPSTLRPDARFWLSSIYYDSGISLVADKDFDGYKAGENIMQDAIVTNDPYTLLSKGHCCIGGLLTDNAYPYNKPILPDLPFSYQGFFSIVGQNLFIPNRGCQIVDEDVTFTLSMPVKVGLYLTWLNDTLSDPDAPFPYREETLTCTFTIHKGLH